MISVIKVKRDKFVELSFVGLTSANVDVYRDNNLLATTENDGVYLDALSVKSALTYTYYVCETGTSTCSAEQSITF